MAPGRWWPRFLIGLCRVAHLDERSACPSPSARECGSGTTSRPRSSCRPCRRSGSRPRQRPLPSRPVSSKCTRKRVIGLARPLGSQARRDADGVLPLAGLDEVRAGLLDVVACSTRYLAFDVDGSAACRSTPYSISSKKKPWVWKGWSPCVRLVTSHLLHCRPPVDVVGLEAADLQGDGSGMSPPTRSTSSPKLRLGEQRHVRRWSGREARARR